MNQEHEGTFSNMKYSPPDLNHIECHKNVLEKALQSGLTLMLWIKDPGS